MGKAKTKKLRYFLLEKKGVIESAVFISLLIPILASGGFDNMERRAISKSLNAFYEQENIKEKTKRWEKEYVNPDVSIALSYVAWAAGIARYNGIRYSWGF